MCFSLEKQILSIEETHLQVFQIIKNLESYNHNIEI